MLAVAGIVVSWRQADRGRAEAFFLGWIVIFIPFLVLGVAVGDVGFITPRRIGLLVALPIVVFAAAAAAAVETRFGLLVLPILVLAIAVPSFAEVVHTRHRIDKLWSDDALGYESFHHALWDPVTADLRREVDENGTVRLLAPDNDASYIWSETGAQPFSLWLQGVIKLGFDPRKATGIGMLERVRATQAAFASGRRGLCALAHREHLDTAVLRGADGLIAYHDLRPAARWRVSPMERSDASISRKVGPGLRYEDKNVSEQLWLSPNAEVPLGFSGDRIRIVDIEAFAGGTESPPGLLLRYPDGSTVVPEVRLSGLTTTYRFRTPDGVPADTRIVASTRVRLTRALGYEPSGSRSIVAPRGDVARPVLVPVASLCRLGGS